MDFKLAIPEDVMLQHLDVLIIANAVGGSKKLTDDEIRQEVDEMWQRLLRIARKCLSDSPSREEKKQFVIAVLEEALRIAKGE